MRIYNILNNKQNTKEIQHIGKKTIKMFLKPDNLGHVMCIHSCDTKFIALPNPSVF